MCAPAEDPATSVAAPAQPVTLRLIERMLFVMAAFAIGRAMVQQNVLTFATYAHGQEQMPFAARYMMQPVLRWAESDTQWVRFADVLRSSSTGPMPLLVQFVNALCLVASGFIADRIRSLFSPPVVFPWLTRWLLLWIVAVTNVVRYEQRYSQAYDMVSLLVFTAGILFCAQSWVLPFLLLVFGGTYNRETTLFLIPVWLAVHWPLAATARARAVQIAIASMAALEWFLVRRQILHWISRGSSGTSFTLFMNLRMLLPHHLPQVLAVGGYMAIPLWIERREVRDIVLRRLWLGSVPFIIACLLFGWLNETRVFNEISVLFAVAAAIVIEVRAGDHFKQRGF